MATSRWVQAIGALAVMALVIGLCLRLAFDAVRLWNAQSVVVADRWTMVGPGDMTSGIMLHLTTRSRDWIGGSAMVLVVCLDLLRRSLHRCSTTTRMGMIALLIVAPTLLTDLLLLDGQRLPQSWLALEGGATLAPLAIWLVWERRSRRAQKRMNGSVIWRAITTIVVVGALVVGVAWLRAGVEIRGRWATFSTPVPSPQYVAPATSEDCAPEALSTTIDDWGRSAEITGIIEWIVVAADGQVFSSPIDVVPPPLGLIPGWRPATDRAWREDRELGPSTGILLLIDERAPRATVEQVERALTEAGATHVARVGARWRELQLLGLPVMDIGALCV